MGSVSSQPAGEEGGHSEPRHAGQEPETQEEVLWERGWATNFGSGRLHGTRMSEQDRKASHVCASEVQGWK